jgi:protoporphyrinogen oxidase
MELTDAAIAILGAGMAGMAAARSLRDLDCMVYEAGRHPGGHASSFRIEKSFLFDEGPHVSFTGEERIQRFLARSVDDRYSEFPALATNYFQGAILKHPVQCNLHGVSTEIITRCIVEFVAAQQAPKGPIETYKDWCYQQLGAGISEFFTRQYTRKYWNRELEQLTADWVSQRIYAPDLEEVVRGALSRQTGDHYYLSQFRYPLENGFGAYNTLLQRDMRIACNMRAQELDLQQKQIFFENGASAHYEQLISSMPLPELVRLCRDVPSAVREAAGQLACTSHFLLSLGIARPQVSDACWSYFYDEEIPFSRASFPSKFSPDNAPAGHCSIQLEVVHSRFKPIPGYDFLIEQCLDSLIKLGLLHGKEEIVALDARDIQYANVIFDLHRAPNVALLHDFLLRNDVRCCGRYGEWAYLWSDQAMLSGERAANEVRELLHRAARCFDDES